MLPTKEEWNKALEERHGKELQQAFSSATVAVCGLGGLGSNIAIALARAGMLTAKQILLPNFKYLSKNATKQNIGLRLRKRQISFRKKLQKASCTIAVQSAEC